MFVLGISVLGIKGFCRGNLTWNDDGMRVRVSTTYSVLLEQKSTHSNAEATLASSFEARVFGDFMVIKLVVLDEIAANKILIRRRNG